MNDYLLYVQADKKWRIDTSKQVETQLKKDGFKYAYLLYNEKGELRTEKEFYTKLKESGAKDYLDIIAHNQKLENQVQQTVKNTKGSSGSYTGGIGSYGAVGGSAYSAYLQSDEIPEELDYKSMVRAANQH